MAIDIYSRGLSYFLDKSNSFELNNKLMEGSVTSYLETYMARLRTPQGEIPIQSLFIVKQDGNMLTPYDANDLLCQLALNQVDIPAFENKTMDQVAYSLNTNRIIALNLDNLPNVGFARNFEQVKFNNAPTLSLNSGFNIVAVIY